MDVQYLLVFAVSLIVTLIVMPLLIPYLHQLKFSQVVREEGLESHKVKTGTPTMGGVAFVIVPILVCLLLNFGMVRDPKIQIVVLAYAGYALIGFLDDFLIVVKKNNDGLNAKVKFFLQSLLAILFFFMYKGVGDTTLWIPIIDCYIELGPFYFVLVFIMFTAESNALNLTDGLDGLCGGLSVIALIPFLLFAKDTDPNLALFLVAVIASLLGYLRYNIHPAKIFMGDSGSLALGGLFAASALVMKKELILVVVGLVFIIETLSVIIQVVSFKTRGKRVFKMAPIHHHLELSGMSEVKVVYLFYIIGILCAVTGYWLGAM